MVKAITRCEWPGVDPLYLDYHDQEWGVPLYDDQKLFEFLILEGMQAGLSWLTVLRKREHFRQVFSAFDPEKVAGFTSHKIQSLLQDPGIIRNRLKVNAAVKNAKAYLALKESGQSFSDYLWGFMDGEPQVNHWKTQDVVPCYTSTSDALAKDLKQRGFSFVGTKICYAFMQATGMVNDHLLSCFRHSELS